MTTTDAAGGGPFSAATSMVVGSSNMAVYEVLFADPFSLEYADVHYTVVGGPSAGVTATATFAPFYADAASAQPSATGFVPRFAAPSLIAAAGLEAVIHGFGLAADTEASLDGYLNTAMADLAASKTTDACIALIDLIGDAVGQVIFGKLKVNDATTLIVGTVELQGKIGCKI